MASKKTYKVDIFELLRHIDSKDRKYYGSLSEEEQKAVSPFVIMQWLSGTKDARQIVFLNELVNPTVFSFSKHKDLVMSTLLCCTSGNKKRYAYPKKPKKKASISKLVGLVKEHYNYSTRDAADALPLLSDEDLLSYATAMGYQTDDIKLIKKELKARVKV